MNKIIVITGGSDGLGLETAKLLSKENTVIILVRNEDSLKLEVFLSQLLVVMCQMLFVFLFLLADYGRK